MYDLRRELEKKYYPKNILPVVSMWTVTWMTNGSTDDRPSTLSHLSLIPGQVPDVIRLPWHTILSSRIPIAIARLMKAVISGHAQRQHGREIVHSPKIHILNNPIINENVNPFINKIVL